ncbi:MAG: carbonic anhydrase [Myxococcota bacterium]
MKLKVQPLAVVLAAQMVVLVAAVVFMAVRASAPPPAPAHRAAPEAEPDPEPEVEPHALRLTAPPPPPSEWQAFPGDAGPVAEAAPADAHAAHAENQPAKSKETEAKVEKHAAPPEAQAAAASHDEPHLGAPEAAPEPARGPETFEALVDQLVAGNDRFVEGVARQRDTVARRALTAREERADAVIVTCTDSRVVPELLFDQPLGTFAVVRTPAAVVDDGSARAVEDALKRLQPKAVLVVGHVGCHHVERAVASAPKKKVPRATTLTAALSGLTAAYEGEALEAAATERSVSWALKELRRRSKAVARTEVPVLRLVYVPATGKVRWLDAEEGAPAPEAAPRVGRHP